MLVMLTNSAENPEIMPGQNRNPSPKEPKRRDSRKSTKAYIPLIRGGSGHNITAILSVFSLLILSQVGSCI